MVGRVDTKINANPGSFRTGNQAQTMRHVMFNVLLQAFLSNLQEILDYLRDLSDLAHTKDFDEGIFQVYLGLGRSIVESNELEGRKSLVASFAYALDSFNASWKLSTGLSMERLWSMFEPPIAHSLQSLEYTLEVEQLADRFDVLKWRSNASLKELERIQHLMVLCMELGYRNEIADEIGLEVNQYLCHVRQ